MKQIRHERFKPEREKRSPLSIRIRLAGVLIVLIIIYAGVMFLYDRQYTHSEKATYRICSSISYGIARAGSYLQRLKPSVGNKSMGEVNRAYYISTNHVVDQVRDMCRVMENIDRSRWRQWSRMGDALLEMEENLLEKVDVRAIDQTSAQVLVVLGEQIRRLGLDLLDDEEGAVRRKTYTDSYDAGVVMGVIIDGERLDAANDKLVILLENATNILS